MIIDTAQTRVALTRSCSLSDPAAENKTKKELGDDYNMRAALQASAKSGMNQIAALKTG